MQEKLTINLSPGFVKAFQENINLATLNAELAKQEVQIASLLTGYHWSEKGIVNSIRIEPGSVKIDETGKGSFKVAYAINIHYGCSDVDIDLDKSMLITIAIDLPSATALLTGEYIPEREPDGY